MRYQVREDRLTVVLAEVDVERRDGRAEPPARQQRDGERRLVADLEREAVAGAETAQRERGGARLGAPVELARGEGALVPDQRGRVGRAARARLQEGDEAQGRKSFRSSRCQTAGGTRWRGVYAASEGLAVASTPHFAV